MLNRGLDIIVSLLGLLILLLMLPAIAILIKLDSPGPVFYAGHRVGKDGKLFRMFKFRTMYGTSKPFGASVSPQGDPRVTPVGLWLRRLKLNEFPQFYNILRGDMTLVGPRPETPDMAEKYPPEAKRIFSVKPGLVGPTQILGRNEAERYPRGVDPVRFYLEEILPRKLPVDLEYIETRSFLTDLKYLLLGFWVTITGAISRQHLTDNLTQILMLIADTLCCLASFTLAHFIRFDGFPPGEITRTFWYILPLTVLTRIPLIFYMGGYQTLIRYFGLNDLKRVFQAVFLGSLLLVLCSYFAGVLFLGYGRGVFVVDWLSLTVMLLGYRIMLKTLHQFFMKEKIQGQLERVALIWGSGEQGVWCSRYLAQSRNPRYYVVGFINDEAGLQHKHIDGLRVLGDHHHLEMLARIYHIQELFVAMPHLPSGRLDRVRELCQRLNITLLRFLPRSVQEIPIPEPLAEPQAGEPSFSAVEECC
jgi:lipopolysaccharide/colanic/teichoic acid biosynthesis glycosyltransferase|uniref:Bacterial sugar transferase domain-containing protein n=1 Tax=Desulfobacca acetoxidans TaxID=60893 RepID=A0A7V6A0T0_9BACT